MLQDRELRQQLQDTINYANSFGGADVTPQPPLFKGRGICERARRRSGSYHMMLSSRHLGKPSTHINPFFFFFFCKAGLCWSSKVLCLSCSKTLLLKVGLKRSSFLPLDFFPG